MKEKIKDKEDLIDTVYDQIMDDIKIGYGEAIEELITFLPVVNLIEYLPEKRWEEFKHLREDISTKNELIHDIVQDLMENEYDSQQYIKDLLIEALSTRTLEDLKEINA